MNSYYRGRLALQVYMRSSAQLFATELRLSRKNFQNFHTGYLQNCDGTIKIP